MLQNEVIKITDRDAEEMEIYKEADPTGFLYSEVCLPR
jgi:hypothetical protein